MSLPTQLADRLALPVICSPMFILSNPEMVIEQCKAGLVGSFPALNARPAEKLDEWITQIQRELEKYQAEHPDAKVGPFAVNQICHSSNERLAHDVEVCVKHKVPIVITSLRAPTDVVDAIHSYVGLVFHDVINVRHAKKALSAGVDGLILVSAGAGGHAGALSPFALLTEIRSFYDGTVILAGSLTKGHHILSAEVMGADLAYMGTRFIATREANADQAYKEMVTTSSAADVVYTNLFTGVHGNYLRGSIENAGLDPENLGTSDPSKMQFSDTGSKSKAWKDIWGAGQGVGSITSITTVAETAADLKAEYAAARARFGMPVGKP
ncbi:MAG: nitronate monooxygenase [Alteromonadaceae bacterium]|nr:nitronate monooxygenase [Alteromonadaceae bacterium]|tara:strand:- start:1085 stop:2059 length:975 start_codon:yes stop_codon:yes gene_type:complete